MSAVKVVVVMDGGVVQQVLADRPVQVLVVDYDTEGADACDLTPVPQGPSEEPTDACLMPWISDVQVLPERVAEMFGLL